MRPLLNGNAVLNVNVLVRVSGNRGLHGWLIGLFVLGLWWTRFFTVPEYFQRTYELGWYPPDGDSIGIPIAGKLQQSTAPRSDVKRLRRHHLLLICRF